MGGRCSTPRASQRLRAAFAIDSPFWEQTDYSARGYFSFWEATAAPPATLIDVYVRSVLLPLVANADDVVGAEWSRAHARLAPLDWPPDAF